MLIAALAAADSAGAMSAREREAKVWEECAAVVRIARNSGRMFCCFLACDSVLPLAFVLVDCCCLPFDALRVLSTAGVPRELSMGSTEPVRFFADEANDALTDEVSTIGQPKPARGVKSGLFSRRMSSEL